MRSGHQCIWNISCILIRECQSFCILLPLVLHSLAILLEDIYHPDRVAWPPFYGGLVSYFWGRMCGRTLLRALMNAVELAEVHPQINIFPCHLSSPPPPHRVAGPDSQCSLSVFFLGQIHSPRCPLLLPPDNECRRVAAPLAHMPAQCKCRASVCDPPLCRRRAPQEAVAADRSGATAEEAAAKAAKEAAARMAQVCGAAVPPLRPSRARSLRRGPGRKGRCT